jgi:CHRD domain-containing protein
VKRKLAPLAALGIAALTLSAGASGGTHAAMKFTAVLNAGQETPHAVGAMSGASGKFTATVTGKTVKWTLTFSHLTGAASAAHIHAGKKGVAGAVLVPLCGPCKSPASGTATLTSAQIASMKAGATYVNVHTAKNANGEIRGQIKMSM